jgi:hypothetical protein
MNNFKIIKRKSNYSKKSKDSLLNDFNDRDYNKPLSGCSNYEKKLKVNDIIGIKFKMKRNVKIDYLTKIFNQDVLQECKIPDLYYQYDHIEEHMFKINEIINMNKILIRPVYLDNDKVIHHESYYEFTKKIDIPKKLLKKEYLIEYYIENFLEEDLDFYTTITQWHLDDVNLFIKTNDFKQKSFRSFKKIYILPNTKKITKKYFDLIYQNQEIFINNLGPDILKHIGTYQDVVENNEKIYQEAITNLNDIIKYEIGDCGEIEAKLEKPYLSHNIFQIKKEDVYRVYNKEENYRIQLSNYIYNNDKQKLKDSVRKLIRVNDKVAIKIINDETNEKFSLYFKLIYKLSNNNFLGILFHNKFFDDHEDIILNINTKQVQEVYGFQSKHFLMSELVTDN